MKEEWQENHRNFNPERERAEAVEKALLYRSCGYKATQTWPDPGDIIHIEQLEITGNKNRKTVIGWKPVCK